MKIAKKAVLLLCMVMLLNGCAQDAGPSPADPVAVTPADTPAASTPAPTPQPSRQISIEIESEAVADNMLEEPSAIDIRVYLPPSYFDEPEKRYPTVYFLHGYSNYPGTMTVPGVMDRLMRESGNEFIIVEPSGHNQFGGSFYVNSPVTGRWEDFISQEVIKYIDGCMLAYSPGLLVNEELESAFAIWDSGFERAYGAAFSPDLAGESPYAGIPQFDGTDNDNQMLENWLTGFGNINERTDAYLTLNTPLKAIKIIVGTRDSYPWIPNGCRAFAARLEELGQTMTLQEHDGGHTVPFDTINEDFILYFAENLVEQP